MFVEIDAHQAETDARALENGHPSLKPRTHKNVEPSSSPIGYLTVGTRYLRLKATVEFLLALGLLVISAPVILISAVLVKLTSRGPAFYTQTRIGKKGRLFTIYKLRTMIHNCESLTGPRWALPGDPRITFVGRFLRLMHIDELPQLLNVLRGEMGLIGPRPERPELVPELEQGLPRYRERLIVKPGLTGLAQIQLPPDTDLDSVRHKLACDLYYVENLGAWLDLSILFCTVLYVLGVPERFARKLFGVPSAREIEQQVSVEVQEVAEPQLRKSA